MNYQCRTVHTYKIDFPGSSVFSTLHCLGNLKKTTILQVDKSLENSPVNIKVYGSDNNPKRVGLDETLPHFYHEQPTIKIYSKVERSRFSSHSNPR